MQLLVAGGGIGGWTTALALTRQGHRVELLEQAGVFAEVGAGIQLGPNAMRRLAALGLGPALDGIAAQPDALVIASAVTGSEIARMPLGAAMRQRYGAPYCCVHRADLHALLHAAALESDGAVLALGARITQIETYDDAVAVATADARAWEGDALVGADGLWSAVRPKIVDVDPAPRSTGHTAWRGLIDQRRLPAAQRSADVRVWLGPRLHAVAYPVRRGEGLNVVVLAESAPAGDVRDAADARAWDRPATLDALQRATGRCCSTLQALMHAMEGWRAWSLHDREPLAGPQDMANGRIALVGDAAHPMLPYLAQGAGMAIEDAVALADALQEAHGKPKAVPAAFARYAEARWKRNARVQARARRNAAIFHLAGPMRLARDLSLKALGPRLIDVPWLYGG